MGWSGSIGKETKEISVRLLATKVNLKEKKRVGEFKHLPSEEQLQEIRGSGRMEMVGNDQI